MNRIHLSIFAGLLASALTATAQNTPPIVKSTIANFTEYAGAPQRSIDLNAVFADSDVSDGIRMTTPLGVINLALYGQQKPITVANFLRYIDSGRYFFQDPNPQKSGPSFIHRSVPGFIIQGGGFLEAQDSSATYSVLTFPPIQNEPGISNKRGTIAMAKLSGDPNSATSQWFINLADNGGAPSNLDTQNGGFTVFGRVVGSGMSVVDAIAALPRINAGAPFDQLPVRNYTSPNPVTIANLVTLPAIEHIPTLSFTAQSSNPAVVAVSLSGSKLLVAGKQNGSAAITITATDLDGAETVQQFTVNVISAPGRAVNVSTRLKVGTADDAMIGGFIMRGPSPKRLMIRGIGPSSGLQGALADPVVELHDGTGAIIATNDNWVDAPNKQDMIDTGIAPSSPNESAILITVPSDPGNAFYTAIVTGANNTTGLGLVEVFDLDSGPGSTLLNISTRGPVGVDPAALIGGFYLGGTESKRILVRAIGPTLASFVAHPLANPILELRNEQGTLLEENDDWAQSPEQAEIQASGAAPTDPKESAVLKTLSAGPYTAIVRGVGGTTGIGSVEVYQLP
ncbi:MAG: peptidyl-prolyl cis-trans isomerase [Verrucomicrobiota bacterium]|jgi:cyclophilin family peptidyl-prolyl cis-trans isomerase